jgi:hypothetical protein
MSSIEPIDGRKRVDPLARIRRLDRHDRRDPEPQEQQEPREPRREEPGDSPGSNHVDIRV